MKRNRDDEPVVESVSSSSKKPRVDKSSMIEMDAVTTKLFSNFLRMVRLVSPNKEFTMHADGTVMRACANTNIRSSRHGRVVGVYMEAMMSTPVMCFRTSSELGRNPSAIGESSVVNAAGTSEIITSDAGPVDIPSFGRQVCVIRCVEVTRMFTEIVLGGDETVVTYTPGLLKFSGMTPYGTITHTIKTSDVSGDMEYRYHAKLNKVVTEFIVSYNSNPVDIYMRDDAITFVLTVPAGKIVIQF